MSYKNKEDQKIGSRKHYLKNRQKIIDRARIYTDKHRKEIRDYILNIKKESRCKDCKLKDYRVLDFHHIRDKEIEIACIVSKSWSLKRVKKEIDKCIILCANCHRIRHFK